MFFKSCWLFIIFFTFSNFAVGEEQEHSNQESDLKKIVSEKIKDIKWLATRDIIIDAVAAQNKQNLSMEIIKERDESWKSNKQLTEFKLSLEKSDLGQYLKGIINNSKVFNEIFITDAQGANVANFPATSDYWQGDEEKFLVTKQTNKIYISKLDFDESTQTKAVQVSVPIMQDDKFIGVLIAGVKMSYLEYKVAIRNQKNKFFQK